MTWYGGASFVWFSGCTTGSTSVGMLLQLGNFRTDDLERLLVLGDVELVVGDAARALEEAHAAAEQLLGFPELRHQLGLVVVAERVRVDDLRLAGLDDLEAGV